MVLVLRRCSILEPRRSRNAAVSKELKAPTAAVAARRRTRQTTTSFYLRAPPLRSHGTQSKRRAAAAVISRYERLFCVPCAVAAGASSYPAHPSHPLCRRPAVFVKTPAEADAASAESGESACAPTEINVLLNRPADDVFDFARRSLRRPSSRSCSSFSRHRRRYETSRKSRLRPRTRGLSRHVAVSHGSDRGLCVGVQATDSNRRSTSTNALNDRVLRSTDGSLDGLIRNPS
jgi:hypothetical protein